MGLFRRSRAPELHTANVGPGWEKQRSTWLSWEPPVNIVREGFYQEALIDLCGEPCEAGYLIPVEVVLRREPDNQHDRNAISVHISGQQVGHIHRDVAAQVSPLADRARCAEWRVCGVIRGGSEDYDKFGVHVWPQRLLSEGLQVRVSGGPYEVSWPPYDEDLYVAIHRLRDR